MVVPGRRRRNNVFEQAINTRLRKGISTPVRHTMRGVAQPNMSALVAFSYMPDEVPHEEFQEQFFLNVSSPAEARRVANEFARIYTGVCTQQTLIVELLSVICTEFLPVFSDLGYVRRVEDPQSLADAPSVSNYRVGGYLQSLTNARIPIESFRFALVGLAHLQAEEENGLNEYYRDRFLDHHRRQFAQYGVLPRRPYGTDLQFKVHTVFSTIIAQALKDYGLENFRFGRRALRFNELMRDIQNMIYRVNDILAEETNLGQPLYSFFQVNLHQYMRLVTWVDALMHFTIREMEEEQNEAMLARLGTSLSLLMILFYAPENVNLNTSVEVRMGPQRELLGSLFRGLPLRDISLIVIQAACAERARAGDYSGNAFILQDVFMQPLDGAKTKTPWQDRVRDGVQMSVFYRDMGSFGTYGGFGEDLRVYRPADNRPLVCQYMANQLRVVVRNFTESTMRGAGEEWVCVRVNMRVGISVALREGLPSDLDFRFQRNPPGVGEQPLDDDAMDLTEQAQTRYNKSLGVNFSMRPEAATSMDLVVQQFRYQLFHDLVFRLLKFDPVRQNAFFFPRPNGEDTIDRPRYMAWLNENFNLLDDYDERDFENPFDAMKDPDGDGSGTAIANIFDLLCERGEAALTFNIDRCGIVCANPNAISGMNGYKHVQNLMMLRQMDP